jgi:hypothetical protein
LRRGVADEGALPRREAGLIFFGAERRAEYLDTLVERVADCGPSSISFGGLVRC